MQTTSTDYKLEIKKPSRSFECKVTIGNNIYTNYDIVDIILETIQPGEGFSIGNTPSQTLDLTLLNRGDIIYSTSQVKVEIGLKIGAAIEYILMGYFNIDDIEKTDYTTKITAYDNMIKFETPYFSSLGDTPTLQQAVNELATKTGVQFTGSLPAYTVKKLEGFTCREILGYVSSLCGGNALITRDGKFTIVTPKNIDYSITPDNYIDYKREEVKYKIGKVSCKVGDKELNKGSLGIDSMEVKFENPWVTDGILNDIYTKLNGFEYLGYTMKWQGDISLDVGDTITCTDIKGAVRKIPILSQKFTYNGGLTAEIGAKGETKNKNSFNSSGSGSNKFDRVVTDLLIVNKALIDKANIQQLEAVSIRTQKLEAKTAAIEVAIIDVAHVSDLTAINANIEKLVAADATMGQAIIGKANITDLTASVGRIEILESSVGDIQTLVNGNLTSNNIQSLILSSDKVTVVNGFIKNAMIENLDVAKINAGDISVNKFRIKSDSGNLLISDNTIQIKDSARVRVQIGKDASNDYNMYVWDSTGKLMFDATGLKADGIKGKIIRDDMVSDTANIQGNKLNISSVVTSINNGTTTLNSSKVLLDGTAQTLNVAFNTLTTKVDSAPPSITTDSSITKLDGAIDGMLKLNSINGRTLQNLLPKVNFLDSAQTYSTTSNINVGLVSAAPEVYNVKPNTEYTLIFKVNYTNCTLSYFYLAMNYTNTSDVNKGVHYQALTATDSGKIFKIKITTTSDIKKIVSVFLGGKEGSVNIQTGGYYMVLEGDWTNKEVPYFEGIRSVAESGENLEVVSCGKNLFDGKKVKEVTEAGRVEFKNNTLTINKQWGYPCKNTLKLKSNTVYKVSGTLKIVEKAVGVIADKSNRIFLRRNKTEYYSIYRIENVSDLNVGDTIKISNTIETPANINEYTEMVLYSLQGNTSMGVVEIIDFQIEEGTTPTICEPYKEHRQPISLTEPRRGLPNGVRDIVDFEKGVVIKNVGKIVLNGSEYYSIQNNTLTNAISFATTISPTAKDYSSLICDKLKYLGGNEDEGHIRFSTGSAILIFVPRASLVTQDLAGFKAWLQANPVTVYYQLAIPVEEPINVEQYMKQFKDGYFNIDGSLINPTIELEYSTSLASATSMMKEVTESNSTYLNVQQGKIDSLISNTTIVKDGQTIQLKDSYNSTVATVDSISNVISSHTSTIDALTGQVTEVNTKTNEVRRDLDGTIETVSKATTTANSALSKASEAQQTADGFSQRVSAIETDYATTSAMNSAITQSSKNIKLEVSNDFVSKNDATLTYATKSSLTQTEDSIVAKFTSSGGYNLLKNSAFANKDTVNWGGSNVGVYRGNDSYFMPEYGCIAIQLGSGNRGVFLQVLSETLIKNKTYTLSLKSWREQNVTVRCVIDYYNGSTWVSATGLTIINDSSKRQNHTFTVPNVNFTKTQIYFEFNRVVGTTGYVVTSLEKPCLCEGDVAVWSPHPSELIDGSTQIDANGVTIYNGAIDVRNRAGASVLKGDSNGNLMVRGNLYADPANPILHLFGGCSLDATYNNEQGIGSSVRLKWDASNYIRISNSDIALYQGGIARYAFTSSELKVNTAVMYINDQCKIDCAGGTFRMYISKTVDTGIRVSPDGTIAFLVNGTSKHVFYPGGTKAGGTIEVDGVTLGMSPIDSPQVLLESVLFDVDVQEEGTTVVLDSTFLKTISTYAVFCSNHNVNIVSKDRTSFAVRGYTGKVDFRVIGYRIGYEEQYYQVVS